MPYKIKAMAGKPYRPSNGTEDEMFREKYCYHCKHYEFTDVECDQGDLINRGFWHDPDDEEYPIEWTHTDEGEPVCTAYEEG